MVQCIKTSVLLALLMLGLQSGQAGGSPDSTLPLFAYPLQEIQQPASQKSAVVIAHGWNAQAVMVSGNLKLGFWPYGMGEQICSSPEVQGVLDRNPINPLKDEALANNQLIRVCQGQNWDVWVVDWMTLSGQCFDPHVLVNRFFPCNEDPEYAYWNASFSGDIVARYLEKLGYKRFHLIAHSAGSNLIETVKDHLLASATKPDIHMTFLDPYDPPASDTDISRYGKGAAWIENYIDTSIVGGTATGIDDPKNALFYGFNFDITGVPNVSWKGHSRPYKFYDNSIGDPGYRYGFPLSLEFNGTIDILSSLKPYRTCTLPDGRQPCTQIRPGKPVSDIHEVVCHAGVGKCVGEIAHQTSEDAVSLAQTASGFDITLKTTENTSDPAAIFLTQFVPEGATHVSFDYRIDGDRGGVVIATFDGKAVRLLTGAISDGQTTKVMPVWLGDSTLEGNHDLGFVLKNVFGGKSTLHVENIVFHRFGWKFNPIPKPQADQESGAISMGWSALRGATFYRVQVLDSQGSRYTYQVSSEEAGCGAESGACRWSFPASLPEGKTIWRVAGGNVNVVGEWSNTSTFHVLSPPDPVVAGDSGGRAGGGALSLIVWSLFGVKRRHTGD